MILEDLCYAICFLTEGITAWLYMAYIYTRKKSDCLALLSFVIGYCLLFLISSLRDSNVNAIAFCIVNVLLIKMNYQCSVREAVLHMALLCFLMTGAEVLVALLFDAFGYDFSAHRTSRIVLFAQILFSKFLYLVLTIVVSRVFSPHKDWRKEPRAMLLFCCLPLVSAMIAILSVYLGMTMNNQMGYGIMMLLTIVALLAVNLLFLVLYNYMEKSNEAYITLQLSRQKELADLHYYEALQQQYDAQRILVHDIKNHLNVIQALAAQCGAEPVERYLATLDVDFLPKRQAKLCTEPFLNLLLLQFQEKCERNQVQFYCDIRDNITAFLDVTSMTALYGNLLSNAFTSALGSQKKIVDLSARRNNIGTVVIIKLRNSCDIAPVPDGKGSYRTQKQDKILHGIGLQSIRHVVKKYDGLERAYYNAADREFHHIIQLPIPEPGPASRC